MVRVPARIAMSLLLLFGAVACGGDGAEDGTANSGATASTGATAGTATSGGSGSTSDATGATAPPQLLENGALDPGTYRFDGFAEPMSLTLGEGWEAFVFEQPDEGETALAGFVALFNADHPAANIALLQPTRLVDPAKDWDEEGNLVPVPDDLVAWFEEHPMHDTDPAVDASIAGLPARSVDLVVADVPKNGWPGCGGECIVWAPISVEHEDGPLTDHDLVFGGALAEVDRQIVVVVGGQQLLIDIGAGNRKAWNAFLPLAEEVLSTVHFG
jgi:hypothetical protein